MGDMIHKDVLQKLTEKRSVLEERVEEIAQNPALLKKMFLQILPQIFDYLIPDNEIKEESSREKRSLNQVESKEDTINFFGLELESASGRVWKKSLEASLHEQKMYNTATSALVKGVVRWAAWTVFAVGVHGADNLFSF